MSERIRRESDERQLITQTIKVKIIKEEEYAELVLKN